MYIEHILYDQYHWRQSNQSEGRVHKWILPPKCEKQFDLPQSNKRKKSILYTI